MASAAVHEPSPGECSPQRPPVPNSPPVAADFSHSDGPPSSRPPSALSSALAGTPFPSPGSPFLPPPSISSHEFASKPSSMSQIMQTLNTRLSAADADRPRSLAAAPDDSQQVLSPTVDGNATPTAANPAAALSPVTPKPNTSFQIQIPPAAAPDVPQDVPPTPLSNVDRLSLTSSRPAPPSPAASRRASTALSRHSSSAKSRRQSRVASLSLQSENEKLAPSSSSNTVKPDSPPGTARRSSWLVKIRDFAFPSSDDRHVGRGPDVPRQNRPRHRWSTLSVASSSSRHSGLDEDAEEDQRHSSWSPFRWNTLSSHFSWAGVSRSQEEDDGGGPSRVDFERNFDASSPVDESDERAENAEDGDQDEEYNNGYPDTEEPLIPGLYRALYAFEPEGTAEMALEEEQVVRIIGRGGGVGWAIVEKDDGSHALVPESYLELIQADEA
ncbi:hypothetical protein K474DRAFT_1402038 [Panus rudis PR-1116 ss-1]|nr:hypothetical protein K474DRAFT_1402038 [Panus rudis PR-1116 ss-1]